MYKDLNLLKLSNSQHLDSPAKHREQSMLYFREMVIQIEIRMTGAVPLDTHEMFVMAPCSDDAVLCTDEDFQLEVPSDPPYDKLSKIQVQRRPWYFLRC
jgi:hypothetical protein